MLPPNQAATSKDTAGAGLCGADPLALGSRLRAGLQKILLLWRPEVFNDLEVNPPDNLLERDEHYIHHLERLGAAGLGVETVVCQVYWLSPGPVGVIERVVAEAADGASGFGKPGTGIELQAQVPKSRIIKTSLFYISLASIFWQPSDGLRCQRRGGCGFCLRAGFC